VGRFRDGDLFVVGSHQPHVFRNDDAYYHPRSKKSAHAISLYFDEHYAGAAFWALEEMKRPLRWLERAHRGYRVVGRTRSGCIACLEKLQTARGVTKLIVFLQLLQLLSESREMKPLSVVALSNAPNHEDKRMNDVIHFTFQHSHQQIYVSTVAEVANLSVEAFCRYFKQRTRKTYTTFLNEVRVSKACQLLIGSQKTIQQVAYEAGFVNLSHFNRVFKSVKGTTPRLFLKQPSA
jgi:AraC-like DNA-binding protein